MRKLIYSLSAALVLAIGAIPAANAFTVVPEFVIYQAVEGNTFTVDYFAAGLENNPGRVETLGAYDFNFNYNPSIVSLTDVTFGNNLDVLGLGNIRGVEDHGNGEFEIYEVSLDDTADLERLQFNSPSGTLLFSLTFKGESEGFSPILLTYLSASSGMGTPLPFSSLTNTAVQVSQPPSPVPLPAGVWLLMSGLSGMGLFGKARRALSVS